MSPRTGRPKAENPKKKQIGVRFDTETLGKLDKLVDHYGTTRVEIIRMGIERLYSDLMKR